MDYIVEIIEIRDVRTGRRLWTVRLNGEIDASFPCSENAHRHADKLWARRPVAVRVAEQLYTGD